MKKWLASLLLATAIVAAAAYPSEPSEDSDDNLAPVYRALEECAQKDMALCLKMRALTFVDRLTRQGDVPVTDGVTLLRTGSAESAASGRAMSEDDLKSSLSQNEEEREAQVEDLLLERIAKFLKSHTLQLKFPESSMKDLEKTFEEGRKKRQRLLLPLLLALKLKFASLIPIAFAALALIAFKAITISKLALLLSIIIGLKKLLSQGGDYKTYEVVAHPHHGHSSSYGDHHYGRALPTDGEPVDAQQMAYRGYADTW